MNVVEKYIRQSVAKAAATSKTLEISELVAGSGVGRPRVLEELSAMVGDGSLQLDVVLDQVTALKFHRLTAHGYVVTQGKLFPDQQPEDAPAADVIEDASLIPDPDLVVGGDTYHASYDQCDDGTWSVSIVENLALMHGSTILANEVFVEVAISSEDNAKGIVSEWLANRVSDGYHLAAFGYDLSANISPFKDIVNGEEATLRYDLDVIDDKTSHTIATFSEDGDTLTPEMAESLWSRFHAWKMDLFGTEIDKESTPAWSNMIIYVNQDDLVAAKNRLAFAAVTNGGAFVPMNLPMFDTGDIVFAVTRIERLRSNNELIACVQLTAMAMDCESKTVARGCGVDSGYSPTGHFAFLVLENSEEARGILDAEFPHLASPGTDEEPPENASDAAHELTDAVVVDAEVVSADSGI